MPIPLAAASAPEVCDATSLVATASRASSPCTAAPGLIHTKLVRLRVDLEEYLAFLDLLVVAHIKIDYAAADLRGHIDDVEPI